MDPGRRRDSPADLSSGLSSRDLRCANRCQLHIHTRFYARNNFLFFFPLLRFLLRVVMAMCARDYGFPVNNRRNYRRNSLIQTSRSCDNYNARIRIITIGIRGCWQRTFQVERDFKSSVVCCSEDVRHSGMFRTSGRNLRAGAPVTLKIIICRRCRRRQLKARRLKESTKCGDNKCRVHYDDGRNNVRLLHIRCFLYTCTI